MPLQLPITTPGQGVFWILPKAYAPQMHVLADGKRGELGAFTLKKGVSVSGRAVNVDVSATDEREEQEEP